MKLIGSKCLVSIGLSLVSYTHPWFCNKVVHKPKLAMVVINSVLKSLGILSGPI